MSVRWQRNELAARDKRGYLHVEVVVVPEEVAVLRQHVEDQERLAEPFVRQRAERVDECIVSDDPFGCDVVARCGNVVSKWRRWRVLRLLAAVMAIEDGWGRSEAGDIPAQAILRCERVVGEARKQTVALG